MSVVLAIDTASDAFALALAVDTAVTAVHVQEPGRDHSAQLVPSIESLLGDRRDLLEAVVVVIGPGSYAGLRVGISTAQGLAVAKTVPVIGVPTLEAVVRASGAAEGFAAHPAGRGTFAYQQIEPGGVSGELLMAPGADLPRPVVGEGTSTVAIGGSEVGPADRVRAALEIGLEKLASGEYAADVDAIYLREPHITVSRRIQTAQIPGG